MALGKLFFRVVWFSLVRIILSTSVIIFHSPSTWYDCIIWQDIWIKHRKFPFQINVLKSSPTLWFDVLIWSPLIWTCSLRKGYLFLSWVGGLVSVFIGVADLKLLLLLLLLLFCDSRCNLASTFVWIVELKMFSSTPDCNVVTLYIYQRNRYICFHIFLGGYCTFLTPFCMNTLLGNYFNFFP